MQSIVIVSVAAWLALAPGGRALPARKFGMPAACADSDFCTEPHELYPAQLVQDMLRSANISFAEQAGQREGEAEERDCAVHASEDPIYEIVDARGAVRVVLQAPGGLQRVRLERCAEPGHVRRATAHFSQQLVDEYNLQCVQRKLDMAFLVLSEDWTGIEMVRAKTGIPVRCDCQLFQL